jgi:hypothetical protein
MRSHRAVILKASLTNLVSAIRMSDKLAWPDKERYSVSPLFEIDRFASPEFPAGHNAFRFIVAPHGLLERLASDSAGFLK